MSVTSIVAGSGIAVNSLISSYPVVSNAINAGVGVVLATQNDNSISIATNLVQGTNISLTPGVGGAITIAYTGGRGSSDALTTPATIPPGTVINLPDVISVIQTIAVPLALQNSARFIVNVFGGYSVTSGIPPYIEYLTITADLTTLFTDDNSFPNTCFKSNGGQTQIRTRLKAIDPTVTDTFSNSFQFIYFPVVFPVTNLYFAINRQSSIQITVSDAINMEGVGLPY